MYIEVIPIWYQKNKKNRSINDYDSNIMTQLREHLPNRYVEDVRIH